MNPHHKCLLWPQQTDSASLFTFPMTSNPYFFVPNLQNYAYFNANTFPSLIPSVAPS